MNHRPQIQGGGVSVEVTIGLDPSEFVAFCDEVCEIADRRGHLLAFRKVLSKIPKALRKGLDTVPGGGDAGSAGANHFVVLVKVGDSLLELLSTLRTLDRNLDPVGTVHGNPS
jgi:hypothetical protein